MIKSRWKRWTGHVKCARGIKKVYKEVEPEKKTSLKRYTYYGWITLKWLLKKSNMEGWFQLIQLRVR
jgi:hypothetical protein